MNLLLVYAHTEQPSQFISTRHNILPFPVLCLQDWKGIQRHVVWHLGADEWSSLLPPPQALSNRENDSYSMTDKSTIYSLNSLEPNYNYNIIYILVKSFVCYTYQAWWMSSQNLSGH